MNQNEKPNVVLIIMDCVRADHMSCYGYHRRTTPYLDRLASKGVLYENTITPSTWTLPSHWSIFTGLFPSRHRVWNKNFALSPQYRTIAEILSERGYETAAFSNNPHVGVKNGLGRGFDIFREPFRIREQRTLLNLIKRGANKALLVAFKLKYDGAYRTNRMIKKWLAGRLNHQRPFFLFVNYMEAHGPYQPPWPYRARFMDERVKTASKSAMADYIVGQQGKRRLSTYEIEVAAALYDAAIAFLDAQLRSLSSYMERQGLLDNSLLIITSDHGESLGEHGRIGHTSSWLYDTQVRVPLILYNPRLLPPATRIAQQVQHVDIVPTILAVLGHRQDDLAYQLQGRSLLPEDLDGHGRPFSIIHSHYHWRPEELQGGKAPSPAYEREAIAIRTDDYKYIRIQDGHDGLYHVKQDPDESHNLIGQEPTKASELQSRLREWLASNGPLEDGSQDYAALEVELDKEVEERLRALGYIE